jgi:hypothetical protein
MSVKRTLRGLGFLLIATGFFIITIQPFSTTGAVIDLSTAVSRIWFFIGLVTTIIGILLIESNSVLEFLISPKKALEIGERISRHERQLNKLRNVPYSVRDAVQKGISPKEARIILKEANKNVHSGYWIELDAFRQRAADNQENYPDSTSLARYWGPKEYQGLSRRQLDLAYKTGTIGKTHELIRGSDLYPKKDLRTRKLADVKSVSIPQSGARVLHRHWEINQMHDYRKNPRN